MAQSTKGILLKWGESEAEVAKVVDIKDIPDLGGEPEMLETTTLSDAAQTYILGIISVSALSFTANYTSADYKSVLDDANKEMNYVLEFPDGAKFNWQGQHTVFVNGGGINEVVGMTITVAPSNVVTFTAAT